MVANHFIYNSHRLLIHPIYCKLILPPTSPPSSYSTSSMKWMGLITLIGALAASSAMAQGHIRCQNTIGGPCGDSSRPREMNCCDYGYCQPWNSGYYQCLAKPDKCPKQETDIDFAGNDLSTIYGVQPDKCCDACAATPNCKAYTFVNENPDGKTACYLKTSVAGRVEKKGAVSATIYDVPPPANCPTQELGVDYYGNDIKAVFDLDRGACCDECGETTGCMAYTWLEVGSDGRMSCYLKSSDAGRKSLVGAISGKLKAAPPPADCPTQEADTDYYGNDLKTVYSLTNTQCCDECGKTANCAAYTFVETNADGKTTCYLKSSAAGKTAKKGALSGKRKNVPPPANCPTQETDVDYAGNDIKAVYGLSNGQCCDECAKTSGCTVYTFVESNPEGKTACYLKKSAGGKTAKTGAVSGQLQCPTPLMGQCGSSTTGPLCCPSGAFCQPWDPAYYQCIAVPDAAKCPTVVTGVDFYGGDLEVQYGLLPGSCCDACFNNKDCVVFTFVNFNDNGQSACYLKSKLVEQRANPKAVSGYKIKA